MSNIHTTLTVMAVVLSIISIFGVIIVGASITGIENNIASLSKDFLEVKDKIDSISSPQNRVVTVTVTERILEKEGENRIAEIYNMVKDSVVLIRVISRFGESTGSGFVYDERGYIVTNNHVVEGGLRFKVVFLDNSVFDAELVGTDVYSDLAVLKIDPGEKVLKPLKIGNSTELKIGEQILVVGNPFGLEGTVTTGIVSQKGRLLPTTRGFSIPGIIQIDAAINPGNSGGPLLNMRGEVVGVTTAIESPIRGFVGIGYAIPSTIVNRVVKELIEKGYYEHSWLGIAGRNIDQEIAKALGLEIKSGFLVEEVVRGGPADKSGIRGGDREIEVDGRIIRAGGDVIVGIDGLKISSIEDILTYLEERTSPGDLVILTIVRDDRIMEVEVVLEPRPPP